MTYTLGEAALRIVEVLDAQINAYKALPPRNIREDFVNPRMSKGGHLIGGAEATRDFIRSHFIEGKIGSVLK